MTAIVIARCTRECARSLVSLSYKTKTRIFRHFINEAFSGECTKWVLSSTKVVCNITEPVIRILLVHIVLIRWVKYIFYYRYSYSVKEAYSKQISYCNYVQSTQIQNWRVPFCFIIYILFILNYLSRLKCNFLPLLSRKNKQNSYKQLKPFYTAAETRDWKQFHILKFQVCVSLWTGQNLL